MNAREIIIALHIKNNGDWDRTYEEIKNKADLDFEEILKGVDTSKYITILDSDYPEEFKSANRPLFAYERGLDLVNFIGNTKTREFWTEYFTQQFNKFKKTISINDLEKSEDAANNLLQTIDMLKELKEGKHVIGGF